MSQWRLLVKEETGSVKNKVWVTDGIQTALFKPDSDLGEGSIECRVAEIAEGLGLPCAKVEQIELFGSKGVLSYNFKTEKGMTYCPADLIYSKEGGYTHLSRDSNADTLKRLPSLSVEFVKNNMPILQEGLLSMLFLDCLVSNKDRHGGNWEIMMTEEQEIVGTAPLFDHGMSLQNDYYGMLDDYCMVLWKDGQMELRHYEMFEKLSIYYPEQTGMLLHKSREIALDTFVTERLCRMEEVHAGIEKIRDGIIRSGFQGDPELVEKTARLHKAFGRDVAVEEIRKLYLSKEGLQEEQRHVLQEAVEAFRKKEVAMGRGRLQPEP